MVLYVKEELENRNSVDLVLHMQLTSVFNEINTIPVSEYSYSK